MKMKKFLLALPLLFGQYVYAGGYITINEKPHYIDTLECKVVGPGAIYTSIYIPDIPAYTYILKLDMHNPYNKIETFLANDSIPGTELVTHACERMTYEGHKAYCGINGDFFNVTDHHEFPLGAPRGGSIKDGEIQREPRDAWWGFATIDVNNVPVFDHMEFEGKVDAGDAGTYKFQHVNIPRADCSACDLTFYNRFAGEKTRQDENFSEMFGVERTEVYLSLKSGEKWRVNKPVKCIVGKRIENRGSNPIAADEYVLSGTSEQSRAFLRNLKEGQEITINMGIRCVNFGTYPEIEQMIGGNTALMYDGVLTERNTTENYNAVPYPRTAVGASKDKRWVYLLVADGKTSASIGLTTTEVCDILKHWGAVDAIGLDGGGSSEIIVNNKVANRPADGKERPVGNGWLVVDLSQESQDITRLRFSDYKFELPKYGIIKPKIMGYNQYDRLLTDNLEDVTFSCSPNLGHIDEAGNFVVSGDAVSGTLTAHYGKLEVSQTVYVKEVKDFSIRLDSVLLDSKIHYPIEVETTLEGNKVLIDHNALDWRVEDENICKVNKGVLTAVANGSSMVTGSMNDYQGTLKVNVEIPSASSLPAISFTDPSLKLTSNLKGISMSGTSTLNIAYKYSSTRTPYFTLAKKMNLYSLPKALKIVFNPHELPLNKIVLDLVPNNLSHSVVKEFSDFKVNEDNVIYLSLADLVDDPTDMAIWPLKFNSIKVTLNASGHTVGAEYAFELKEFSLIYEEQGDGIVPNRIGDNEISLLTDVDGTYLSFSMDKELHVSYEIYSVSGMAVKMKKLGRLQTGKIRLDDSGVNKGIYLLKVYKGAEVSVFKFMKY